jgi:hypothetical protein
MLLRKGDIFIAKPVENNSKQQHILEQAILEIVGDDSDIEFKEHIEI